MRDKACILKAIAATPSVRLLELSERITSDPPEIFAPKTVYYGRLEVLGASQVKETVIHVSADRKQVKEPQNRVLVFSLSRSFSFPERDKAIHEKVLEELKTAVIKDCGGLL